MTAQRSPEYQRVREEMADIIATGEGREPTEVVDQILSIQLGARTLKEWIEFYEKGKLAILADDQNPPPMRYGYAKITKSSVEIETEGKMINAGFKRVIKLEGK